MKIAFAAPLVGLVMIAAPAQAQDAPDGPAAPAPVAAPALAPQPVAAVLAVEEAEPAPPAGVAANYAPPPRDADGRWRTPNRALSPDEATWHLRVALNVAALGCRGPEEARMVSGYNALLAERKDVLAAAGAGVEAAYKARSGETWRGAHDDAMTRLYNFFAQPPAQAGFCAEARAVLAEAATVEPGGFAGWAAASLDRLERPFVTFYDAFEGYRIALAGYRARHAPPTPAADPAVVLATTAPVAVVLAAAPLSTGSAVLAIATDTTIMSAASEPAVASNAGPAPVIAAAIVPIISAAPLAPQAQATMQVAAVTHVVAPPAP